MQSGFGMLEAGAVASKNTVNIMVKNVVDVVFGGMTYWMFGYALSFGEGPYSNPFCGLGDFFVDTNNSEDMGLMYATFVFQLSFATTATTIVSGAMAERTNLTAYIVFSLINTVVYCIPAHWVWSPQGFLARMGAVDFAGSGVVHLVGACSGLVATVVLKPRTGRYSPGLTWPPLINPVNAIVGTFMLWWGWLAFNCGSTFGISGGKWMLASKAAFTTLISSMSGGITGIAVSFVVKKGKYDVSYLINAILGALVSITASCPMIRPYEAVLIGMVGALCTLSWGALMDKLRLDDPVSAVAVHGAGGVWGLVAVGLFVEDDDVEDLSGNRNGLLKGGGLYLLAVQLLSIVCEAVWSVTTTFIMLLAIDKTIGLRVSLEEERLGADFCEHGVVDVSILTPNLIPRQPSPLAHDPDLDPAFHHGGTVPSPVVTPSALVKLSPRTAGLDREEEDNTHRKRRRSRTSTDPGPRGGGGGGGDPSRDTSCLPALFRRGVKDKQNGVKVKKNRVKVKKNGVKVKKIGVGAGEEGQGGVANEAAFPNRGSVSTVVVLEEEEEGAPTCRGPRIQGQKGNHEDLGLSSDSFLSSLAFALPQADYPQAHIYLQARWSLDYGPRSPCGFSLCVSHTVLSSDIIDCFPDPLCFAYSEGKRALAKLALPLRSFLFIVHTCLVNMEV
ncbi:putative ammonium transporter 2 [Babylonia areolata]|uniref:putative ammonium transporter 2 n=1 Tax=Babylonia areolata TaxID=304850 RepID=UPI003FD61BF9